MQGKKHFFFIIFLGFVWRKKPFFFVIKLLKISLIDVCKPSVKKKERMVRKVLV